MPKILATLLERNRVIGLGKCGFDKCFPCSKVLFKQTQKLVPITQHRGCYECKATQKRIKVLRKYLITDDAPKSSPVLALS